MKRRKFRKTFRKLKKPHLSKRHSVKKCDGGSIVESVKKQFTLLPKKYWNKQNYVIDPYSIVAIGFFEYYAKKRIAYKTVTKLFCVAYDANIRAYAIYCKSVPNNYWVSMYTKGCTKIFKSIFDRKKKSSRQVKYGGSITPNAQTSNRANYTNALIQDCIFFHPQSV